MSRVILFFTVLLSVTCLLSSDLPGMETEIVHLKTEYDETPLGIDVKQPRFSWQMRSGKIRLRRSG